MVYDKEEGGIHLSHKVEMTEILMFVDHVGTTLDNVKGQLSLIKENMMVVGEMDSFDGKTAKAAKGYLNEFHHPVIATFERLFESLEENLKSHVEYFQSDVDESDTALIESGYLNEHALVIQLDYLEVTQSFDRVKNILHSITDISSVSAPALTKVDESVIEVREAIQKLDLNLSTFTKSGESNDSKTKDIIDYIELTLKKATKVSGETRYSELSNGFMKDAILFTGIGVGHASRTDAAIRGSIRGYILRQANKNLRLGSSKGNGSYTFWAKDDALKYLEIEPDDHTIKGLNQKKLSGVEMPHWKQRMIEIYKVKTRLQYTNSQGKLVWSDTGKKLLKNYPELAYWDREKPKLKTAKAIGVETIKGIGQGFKDVVNVKSIANSGVVNGITRSLAPLGAGLNFYTNYHDAKDSGLKGQDAVSRATVDTTIDTAVAAGVQTAFTAVGTVFIPIPGVGTALGAIAGAIVNERLSNFKFGKSKKTGMERIKGWFH